MLCQECGKEPATMHFTKIVNGDITELHFCENCAKQYKEFDFDTSFSFHKFLTGLIDNIQGEPVKVNHKELKCDSCGMSYSNFRQIGKFGCPDCYKSFESKLNPLFKEVHGHANHTGKIPRRAGGAIGVKKEITRLKNDLDFLVKSEQFEEAAKVRDEIKKLQKEIENK